jgi:hypothetical protein
MSFGSSDTQDVPAATDAGQVSVSATGPLSPTGIKAMQGGDDEYPSPDQRPKSATTELGDASRAETGVEKPEVKWHHEVAEPDKEGKPAGTPEGWRPGGPERG